jgi:hypothetical protein
LWVVIIPHNPGSKTFFTDLQATVVFLNGSSEERKAKQGLAHHEPNDKLPCRPV